MLSSLQPGRLLYVLRSVPTRLLWSMQQSSQTECPPHHAQGQAKTPQPLFIGTLFIGTLTRDPWKDAVRLESLERQLGVRPDLSRDDPTPRLIASANGGVPGHITHHRLL
jgi:hypothetical protein